MVTKCVNYILVKGKIFLSVDSRFDGKCFNSHTTLTAKSLNGSLVYFPLFFYKEEEKQLEDATEIQANKAYVWHDWCLVKGKDCLYIWGWAAALELSNGSNGWFRFMLDGKLATMYSSGSPECGNGNSGQCFYLYLTLSHHVYASGHLVSLLMMSYITINSVLIMTSQ